MASRSCSSWCAEPKASSRISVSSLSFSQSSVRSSETAVSSCSASSVDSMILEMIRSIEKNLTTGQLNWLFQCWATIFIQVYVYSHWGRAQGWSFEGRWLVFSSFFHLVRHLWGTRSWGVRGGNFLDVWVGFGAFLEAESFVEGASQL